MNEKIYNMILNYKPYDEKEEYEKNEMLYFIKNNEDVLTRDNSTGHFTTSAWIFNN